MGEVVVLSKCRALRTELRDMKYSSLWNQQQMLSGAPEMYLRLLHFIFVEYSPEIRDYVIGKGYTLLTSTDLMFVQQIFRILQVEFGYRPKITVENFFKPKFALQKLTMCCDIVKIVKERAKKETEIKNAKSTRQQAADIKSRLAVKRAEQ